MPRLVTLSFLSLVLAGCDDIQVEHSKSVDQAQPQAAIALPLTGDESPACSVIGWQSPRRTQRSETSRCSFRHDGATVCADRSPTPGALEAVSDSQRREIAEGTATLFTFEHDGRTASFVVPSTDHPTFRVGTVALQDSDVTVAAVRKDYSVVGDFYWDIFVIGDDDQGVDAQVLERYSTLPVHGLSSDLSIRPWLTAREGQCQLRRRTCDIEASQRIAGAPQPCRESALPLSEMPLVARQ